MASKQYWLNNSASIMVLYMVNQVNNMHFFYKRLNACLHSSLFRSIMDIQVNKCSKVHNYIFSKYRAASFYRINNKHYNNTTITGVYPTMYFATKKISQLLAGIFPPHHFFLLFLKKGVKGENITFQEAVTL